MLSFQPINQAAGQPCRRRLRKRRHFSNASVNKGGQCSSSKRHRHHQSHPRAFLAVQPVCILNIIASFVSVIDFVNLYTSCNSLHASLQNVASFDVLSQARTVLQFKLYRCSLWYSISWSTPLCSNLGFYQYSAAQILGKCFKEKPSLFNFELVMNAADIFFNTLLQFNSPNFVNIHYRSVVIACLLVSRQYMQGCATSENIENCGFYHQCLSFCITHQIGDNEFESRLGASIQKVSTFFLSTMHRQQKKFRMYFWSRILALFHPHLTDEMIEVCQQVVLQSYKKKFYNSSHELVVLAVFSVMCTHREVAIPPIVQRLIAKIHLCRGHFNDIQEFVKEDILFVEKFIGQ